MITFKQHLSEARKKQNPADYPRVQNALAGRKRKVMFSDDKPEKKARKGAPIMVKTKKD